MGKLKWYWIVLIIIVVIFIIWMIRVYITTTPGFQITSTDWINNSVTYKVFVGRAEENGTFKLGDQSTTKYVGKDCNFSITAQGNKAIFNLNCKDGFIGQQLVDFDNKTVTRIK